MVSTVDEVITEPQQAADYIYKLLDQNRDNLAIAFLGLNERLSPEYPAVIVFPGRKDNVPHGTHIFQVLMEVIIMVWHGNFNESTPDRTRDDLLLVEKIENLIHRKENMDFGGKITFAFVASQVPQTGERPNGQQLISTQMRVSIESRKGFPYGS